MIADAGTVLGGRYRLRRRLGSGGMAAVWLAHDTRLEREVAVKVLSDVLAEDEDYRQRFEREARVAAGLQHPGLVAVYDFGAESGRPYLVMELVRGPTLGERISAGTANELDLVTVARDLLGALAHIHAAGIVHRDVKPGNVLIGTDGRARLTDFGIARPKDATTLTRTGQVIGTLAYMAPELRRGEPATPRSDLYALGTLLRECGGGRDPALGPLIDRLRAEESAGRPADADAAVAILTKNTAPTARLPAAAVTEPLPPTDPTPALRRSEPGPPPPAIKRRRRLTPGLLLAGLAVLATVVVILASGGGGDGSRQQSGQPGQATEAPATSDAGRDPASAPPAQEPANEEPSQAGEESSQVSCAALEEEKKALEEQRKAAEENAGDDKAAKEAIAKQFETDKKALEQRAESC